MACTCTLALLLLIAGVAGQGGMQPACPSGYTDYTRGQAYWWDCAKDCPGGEPWADASCCCACVRPSEVEQHKQSCSTWTISMPRVDPAPAVLQELIGTTSSSTRSAPVAAAAPAPSATPAPTVWAPVRTTARPSQQYNYIVPAVTDAPSAAAEAGSFNAATTTPADVSAGGHSGRQTDASEALLVPLLLAGAAFACLAMGACVYFMARCRISQQVRRVKDACDICERGEQPPLCACNKISQIQPVDSRYVGWGGSSLEKAAAIGAARQVPGPPAAALPKIVVSAPEPQCPHYVARKLHQQASRTPSVSTAADSRSSSRTIPLQRSIDTERSSQPSVASSGPAATWNHSNSSSRRSPSPAISVASAQNTSARHAGSSGRRARSLEPPCPPRRLPRMP
eukprot:gb/GFBE01055276.1/.p1 GENE.gb/GFBE01055276.1/~~gb/GFBE01055276.1/.p1  ORF type:complete len:397 (+),score=33.14 gb/GFBE01055276.1/:1-1191(+)